ncbi:MAG: hypothetical protein J6Q87_02415, partial [Clostridia bacterium]|nr:hypothetical protein [Clostridia bacterium]
NLSNNHTYDFGMGGYADTKAALESVSMPYVEDAGTLLYTTKTPKTITKQSSKATSFLFLIIFFNYLEISVS